MQLASQPPTAIAPNDFWRIIGQYASRGLSSASGIRVTCHHLLSRYTPDMGSSDNPLRLTSDLAATGAGARVRLKTSSACWATDDETCDHCAEPFLFLEHEGTAETTRTQNAARALRSLVLEENRGDLRVLELRSGELFPGLTFHAGAWSRMGSMAGSADEVMTNLLEHLGVLSDTASEIWRVETETTARQAALGALGVDASPENGNTRRNNGAMAERTFEFDGVSIRCEWHTKLRPNVNRIYFAVGQKSVQHEGQTAQVDTVFIGVMIDHLTA